MRPSGWERSRLCARRALDPCVVEALLRRRARGELSDAQLDDAARQISTGELLRASTRTAPASAASSKWLVESRGW
jgi:hypothetical protein